jgi:phospholipid/cholesterol/gamma-HCH transport system substrate-binding protein
MGGFAAPEFKVGLLVLVVATLVTGMTVAVNEDPSYLGSAQEVWFYLDDARGLVEKSSVKMAGINIGIIESIELEGRMAKVVMSLQPDIKFTKSARVEIRATGILGDMYIEVFPGEADDENMVDGGQVLFVVNKGSVDAVVNEIGSLSKSLAQIADNIKAAVEGNDKKETRLGRILGNLETITGDLAELTRGEKGNIKEIIANVQRVTGRLDEFIGDDSDEGFRAGWQSAVASLSRIGKTLQNLEEISEKVNSGEGTIGKLVNDEETVEELNKAITGVNKFIDSASKIQTSIDFHSEYLAEQELYKSYIGVRIQPGLDRYYELQVVDDPKGVSETVDTQTTTAGTTTDTTERKTFRNKVKFTALFAKNFYDFTLRGGLIESTGGVGVDYRFWRRKVKLSMEAFDFGENSVHLRSMARYNFYKGLYIVGGADDISSTNGEFSSYFGAGLDLTNDDLKTLLTKVPF